MIYKAGINQEYADYCLSVTENVTKKKGKFFSLRLAKKILWYNILFKYIIYVYN